MNQTITDSNQMSNTSFMNNDSQHASTKADQSRPNMEIYDQDANPAPSEPQA